MEINKQRSTVRSSATEAIIDQGLRSYMLKVYNYMASGVLLTGFIALLFFKMAVVTSPEGQIVGLEVEETILMKKQLVKQSMGV